VIVLRTFSKIYGLAGLRVGYGVTRPEMAAYMNRIRDPFNVNLLAQAAALAALKDKEHVRRSREMVREGKEFLYRELAAMGLSYVPSQANFILIDVGCDSRKVHKEMILKGVIIRPGYNLGFPNHIRLTVGKREDNERFIRALKEVLR
jgi:histidinol-phosphate aminotransferase